MRSVWAWVLAAGVAFAPSAAMAQHDYTELNVHVGALILDEDLFGEDDTDVLLGARLAKHWDNGWGIGGNFDWTFADQITLRFDDGNGGFDDDIDIALLLYSGEVVYTFPSSGRSNFFVGVGAGGATLRVDDLPFEGDDTETQTNFLLPLSAGFKVHNDPDDPTVAFRFDVRDNIIFQDVFDFEELDEDVNATNNFELSAGVSFFFGGGPPEPPPPTDSDGDGVYDDRDQCPNTPFGTRVDSFGCPVPVDSDGDGVIDDRDQCPNTPPGDPVDGDGCTIEPEPVVACADGRDWYRFNETISVDGRNWVKFGGATTIAMDDLMQIGEYDGVPVYVGAEARPPYTEAYVPLCAPEDAYQPYQVEQEIRGTTG